MITYLRSPLTLVWSLLIGVTFVSWWVGTSGHRDESGISFPITAAVVAIALLKTRLVFWYFMEVRAGPSWLRANFDGWLASLAVILLVFYAYRLHLGAFR